MAAEERNVRKTIMTMLALVLCAPAMAQVFKCPDTSGRTVFQQVPCPGSGSVVKAEPKPAENVLTERQKNRAAVAAWAAKRASESDSDHEAAAQKQREIDHSIAVAAENRRDGMLKDAGIKCDVDKMRAEPSIGMTEAEFVGCTVLGRYGKSHINETTTARGTSRQYVFRGARPSETRYVYTENGKVTAIQK